MVDNSSENKRIAKNTLLLYLRQLLVLAVSLYTSRVILASLGVSDYGIYNVVGSVVTMFTFIRSAMGNATYRYIAFALGKGEDGDLKRIFSTSLVVHTILAVLIILLSEVVGVWLLYNMLVIPADRMTAAFWVLQFSIMTCVIGVLSVPFDAEIIAHEKMGVFAAMSVWDVSMKLFLALLLNVLGFDKLILYGFFLMFVQLSNRIIYNIYCVRKFPETRGRSEWDKSLAKEMFGFASWNLMGNMAAIACTPVLNVFLNMFFGPVVNAARGVAVQIQGAVFGFISNFQMAVNPQITKNYAAGNLGRMHSLIISSSKLSYYLFFCMALPLCLESEQILSIWLVDVPEHAVNFLRLVLFIMLIESWQLPLHTANLATGRVRKFQTIKGLTLFTILPISYIALKMGANSESVFVIQILVTFGSLLIQLKVIQPSIGLSLRQYAKEVLLNALLVSILSAVLPIVLYNMLPHNFATLLVNCVTSVLSVLLTVYLIGLNKAEKNMVNEKIKPIIGKILRRN